MTHRWFHIASLISGVLAAVTTGGIIALVDDKNPSKAVWDWRVSQNYGAEEENIFDGKGAIQVTSTGADFPGIHYRHFRWPDKPEPLWTLMVSLSYPFFLFNILTFLWIFRYRCLWVKRKSDANTEAGGLGSRLN